MSNPRPSVPPFPINALTPPVFPCWLWHGINGPWFRLHEWMPIIPNQRPEQAGYTHWYPDQLEAPSEAPPSYDTASMRRATADFVDAQFAKPIPKPTKPIRMVVCAANRLFVQRMPGGEANPYVVLGPRHFDPTMRLHIEALVAAGCGTRMDWLSSQQGFIDQWGVFMDRTCRTWVSGPRTSIEA